MRRILLSALAFMVLSFGFAAVTVTALSSQTITPIAVAEDFQHNACDGLSQLGGGNPCDDGGAAAQGGLEDTVKKVVNILSMVVGIVAVVMVVVSGFKYITSGGETSRVAGAKNTLIYAIVGLVIVALAQFIVHFVLSRV